MPKGMQTPGPVKRDYAPRGTRTNGGSLERRSKAKSGDGGSIRGSLSKSAFAKPPKASTNYKMFS